MKITIDTDKEIIVVPNTFYGNIDKMNEALKLAGVDDKRIDYVQYVKDSFEKAIANPLQRKSDATGK